MTDAKHTPGPWKLIWHGTERYPYPLSIHTADDANWIARDGTVSSAANARLIAAAPALLSALEMCLAFEKEKAEFQGLSDCTCMNHSRITESSYENGICPHQVARAALAAARGET